MLLILVILLVIIMIASIPKANKQVTVSNYVSRNFEISPESRKMFEKMKKDGVPEEGLKRFVIMEDRLLEYEKDSVCKGISRKAEAIAIDQAIKDSFRGYDFKFHTKHLTQIFVPEKKLNPRLKCFQN
tara:strand:- start:3329 stop:3712 length:384 start_codon:yes stop_codon:yes gene_type:complete